VAQITQSVTNVGTFAGFLANGGTCQASDSATVTVTEPCADCSGETGSSSRDCCSPATSSPSPRGRARTTSTTTSASGWRACSMPAFTPVARSRSARG
jgi:hypothetical protein